MIQWVSFDEPSTDMSDDAFDIKIGKTERGFDIIEFDDRYAAPCSLQKSSLATDDAIWFGIDDAQPQIMARDAQRMGLNPGVDTGWVPYPIPAEVSLTTRMHLTREQVAALLPFLQNFVDTGEIV